MFPNYLFQPEVFAEIQMHFCPALLTLASMLYTASHAADAKNR